MAVSLGTGDILVLVVLGIFVVAKGLYYSYRSICGTEREKVNEPSQFFLAGRSMEWWTIGLSIFASNIGTEHFVGQAGAAAATGMPVAIYEWTAGLLIFFLGWGLAPMYLGLDLMTVPEWFERRFNKWCRLFLAGISIIAYVITKIAASLFAGAVLFDVILEVDMWKSVPVLLVFTAFYSAAGGLKAVMYTDSSQAIIFIIGGIAGSILALAKIGGVKGMTDTLQDSGLGYFTHTLRPISDIDYPWLGMLLGQPIASIWYWCIDQEMVQRVLASKSISHAQGGCVLAGYLKILPPFMMVFPGMIARAFYEKCQMSDGAEYGEWCSVDISGFNDGADANKAYPLLIVRMFPDGLRGLMIVSMVLAMISSLDSVFNCVSSIFTLDVYKRFIDPAASNTKLVWVGRIMTAVAALVSILWLPIIHHNQQGLYLATQNALTHLSPTIVAVFLLGVLWPRANGEGAMAGLVTGFTFGIIRFVTNYWADPPCAAGSGGTFQCMNFNHMALIIFVIVIIVTVMVSGWTSKPEPENLWGTCLYAPESAREARLSDSSAMDEQRLRGDVFRVNPEISKFLLAIGSMLLTVMLALCVGFGYTGQSEKCTEPDPSSCYEATAVSGGMLAILCNIGAATFVLAFFGVQTYLRTKDPADAVEIVERNPYGVPETPGKTPADATRRGHSPKFDTAEAVGFSLQAEERPLQALASRPKCDAEAQTDMKAVDLKNSIVYGDRGRWYTFNQNVKEEDAPDQWFVGSDHELEPPRRPGQIQKPISHVHRDLPRAPGSPTHLPVV
jgi:SSS family solute:Na+ symporter